MTITQTQLEQILTDTAAELMAHMARSDGIRHAEQTRRIAAEHTRGIRSGLGTTGPRASGTSDPTGNTATNPTDRTDRTHDEWCRLWRNIHNDLHRLRTLTTGIHAHASRTDRTTHSHIRLCAVPWCRDDIITDPGTVPDRGRCAPCADYLQRNGCDPGPTTVDARRRKRDQRERETA